MEDKIPSFRQPMVTATGIILGFLLNFSSIFVKTETETSETMSYFIGLCILLGILSLIYTLYRMLSLDYPKDNSEQYYRKTLALFIFGVSVSFVGVLMDMFGHFMSE